MIILLCKSTAEQSSIICRTKTGLYQQLAIIKAQKLWQVTRFLLFKSLVDSVHRHFSAHRRVLNRWKQRDSLQKIMSRFLMLVVVVFTIFLSAVVSARRCYQCDTTGEQVPPPTRDCTNPDIVEVIQYSFIQLHQAAFSVSHNTQIVCGVVERMASLQLWVKACFKTSHVESIDWLLEGLL